MPTTFHLSGVSIIMKNLTCTVFHLQTLFYKSRVEINVLNLQILQLNLPVSSQLSIYDGNVLDYRVKMKPSFEVSPPSLQVVIIMWKSFQCDTRSTSNLIYLFFYNQLLNTKRSTILLTLVPFWTCMIFFLPFQMLQLFIYDCIIY